MLSFLPAEHLSLNMDESLCPIARGGGNVPYTYISGTE